MSLAIITAVRANYPTPLGARHLECLAACARATGTGLVKKTSGTFIPHPTAGGVSQDCLMVATGEAWDILIDAEGAATPAWNSIAPIDPSRYVAVTPQPQPEPDPEPQPQPDPPCDLSPVLAKLEEVQARLDAHADILHQLVGVVLEPHPAMTGKVWGSTVTLRPKEGS
jgi:hypothetical protein